MRTMRLFHSPRRTSWHIVYAVILLMPLAAAGGAPGAALEAAPCCRPGRRLRRPGNPRSVGASDAAVAAGGERAKLAVGARPVLHDL